MSVYINGQWDDSYVSIDFDSLKGKVFTDVIVYKDQESTSDIADKIEFITDDEVFLMFHDQDCCENVYIESVVGDLKDLIGTEILVAEEVTESGYDDDFESWTWTFYKLDTNKGGVTIRWNGYSNGYYSESVSVYSKIK